MQYGDIRKPIVPPMAPPNTIEMTFIMVMSRMSKLICKNSALIIKAKSGLANSNKVAPSTTANAVMKNFNTLSNNTVVLKPPFLR